MTKSEKRVQSGKGDANEGAPVWMAPPREGVARNVDGAAAAKMPVRFEDVLRAAAAGMRQTALANDAVFEWIESILESHVLRGELIKLESSIIALMQAGVDGSDGPDGLHVPSKGDSLSARERSILQLMGCGMSNKKIARHLSIAPETVKTYAKRIFVKLSVKSRAEAVCRASMQGIL